MREGGEKSRNGNGDGERREAKRTEEVTLGPAVRRANCCGWIFEGNVLLRRGYSRAERIGTDKT